MSICENMKKVRSPLIHIINNDENGRSQVCNHLEKNGLRVEGTVNGAVGVKAFAQLQPDAVIIDVKAPGCDGFETCRAIRRSPAGRNVPILMVTSFDDVNAIDQAFDAGATHFITRPINLMVLAYRVKYMLRVGDAFEKVLNQQKQIEQLAFYDHLTGLANRKTFKKTLVRAIDDCREKDSTMAVLVLDLDRFKNINDTLGHQVGDLLIQNVAERIRTCIRKTDAFGRLSERYARCAISRQGGDEFSIMLPALEMPEDSGRVARRINEMLAEPFHVDGRKVFISTSIGISIFPMDGYDAEVLMKHADMAMYHAKENGKNCFQFYTEDLNITAREKFEFENDVRTAVTREEFIIYYQPQVSMTTGGIVGAEALTRWKHSTHGMVSPAKFIPVVEEMGLIIPFTDWLIRTVGRQQNQWKRDDIQETRIAINISSKQFSQQNIPDKISETLIINGFGAHALELELTESVLAEQNQDTISVLNCLKRMGLAISADDFGTGYSSLVYLKNFPIDIVKIDRFFIKDILSSKQDATIVQAIIAMAHSMGMKVVAEGIEEKEQFDVLCQMGCDFGQGFLFSPAVSPAVFSKMLMNKAVLCP